MKKISKEVLAFALLLTLLAAPLVGKTFFSAENRFEVEYFSNNADPENNVVDKVLIYEYDDPGIKIDTGSFIYDEEKERFECTVEDMYEEQRTFFIESNTFTKVLFKISYRLIDNDVVLSEEGVRISRYVNGTLKESTEYLFRDFASGGAEKIEYGYDPFTSMEVLLFYFAFFTISYLVIFAFDKIWYKRICDTKVFLWIRGHLNFEYVYLWIFSLLCFKVFSYFKNVVYLVSHDTVSYCIESIKDLSWFMRMPVYQLLLLSVKKIVGASEWTVVFPYVVYVQIFVATISVLFLYDAAQKILRKKRLAIVTACVYAVLISVFGYTEDILTESLAISLMCIMLWCIVQVISTSKKRYITISCAMALICIFERPSFLFLLPVLAVFFFVYIIWEKKWELIKWTLGSFTFCLLIVFAYCKHNEALTGHFMLSKISYCNQIGIMFDNDMWMNPEYPEISSVAQQIVSNIDENRNRLPEAVELCDRFGYAEMAEYLQSCRRLFAAQYVKQVLKQTELDQSVIQFYGTEEILGRTGQIIFEIVRTSLLPFSFATLLILIVIELLYGIVLWIRKKTLSYMSFGIPGCLLGIYVTSAISLYAASLQRYMVHMLPLVVLLMAMTIEHLMPILSDRNESPDWK